ncbi:transposase [Sinorhizobium meliloti]
MLVVELARPYLDQLRGCNEKIAAVERQMKEEAKRDPEAVRLQTAPRVGSVCAMLIEDFRLDISSFQRGRDFAGWLGLLPLQKSTANRTYRLAFISPQVAMNSQHHNSPDPPVSGD